MKKYKWIVIILIIAIVIGGIFYLSNNSDNNKNRSNNNIEKSNDLDKLKQYFEEYSGIQIFLKSNITIEQANEFADKLKDLKYLKDVNVLSKEDSYNELKNRIGNTVGSIEQFTVPNKIRAKCYYLDDISLLDENGYFEKVKSAITEVDANNIIDNIVTAGIIEIYNKEGMEGVEEYIEKSNYIEDKEKNNANSSEDVTQKINNKQVIHSGIINNIDDKHIYYTDSDSHKLYFEKKIFPYLTGRTFKDLNVSDLKVGDYIDVNNKQIFVFRNLTGEELKQELLYNFTLTNEERIMYVNSIEIEDINIIDSNKAIAKIKYGDIIGENLTNEKFSTLVEFNENTKYYSKGNNIHNVNELENAKGNINSIILKKDSINKKNPAIVISFECDDT